MSPDPDLLSLMRLEFGVAASFHYLFVPLSLGLMLAVALMEGAGWRTGRTVWTEAARYWRRFFVLAWLVGMATGYPLRWQMQSHWQGYTEAAREVLDQVMQLEAGIAPVMLTLVALLGFMSHRMRPATRTSLSALLMLTMATQAAGILSINAWMQHPVQASLAALLASPYAHAKIAHTLSASVLTGALFMLAVAGASLLRQRHLAVARVSMRTALALGLAGTVATLWSGHDSALEVARAQPMKFAAMEAHWSAAEGDDLVLWARPDMNRSANRGELELPHAMGLLVGGDAPPGVNDLTAQARERIRAALHPYAPDDLSAWRALYHQAARQHAQAWPLLDEETRLTLAAQASRPHVPTLFFAFRTMAGTGAVLLLALAWAWRRRASLESGHGGRRTLMVLMACLPLPWIATLSGWVLAEAGRQPWVVYGQVLTSQAAAPLVAPSATMLALRVLAYAVIGAGFVQACIALWRHGPAPLSAWDRWWRQVRRHLPLWQPTRLAAYTSMLDQ